MAVIKLTIHDFLADIEAVKVETISLVTGTDTAQVGSYLYSLVGLSMNKQMYQPTMIVADISINKTEGTTWTSIKRGNIVEMFRFCRITLHGDNDEIGNDFYVHEVIPEYRAGSMLMRLHIFSLDKLLTLKQTSRSFVGKKLLGDILATELPKYLLPFDKGKGMEFKPEDRIKTVHQLVYQNAQKATAEHIFPYLVQYNESFYDLLARTTNRWGEFMYYEDGSLQIGYNAGDQVKTVKNFYKITYSCQDASLELLGLSKEGNYEAEAAYDKNVYDTPIQKSPRFVRGEMGEFNGQGDKYAMKKLASFFNTDKNIVSWIANTLVDDSVSVLQSVIKTKQHNDTQNEKYFPGKGTDEQYGQYTFTLYDKETKSKDAFNQFTEITSQYADKADIYDAKRYFKTLELEQEAANNVVTIDFDTTWPGLKLGNIIEVNGEQFIVVNISATYKDNHLTFQVKASGAHVTEVSGKTIYDFYPAMIPSGHVRYSGPQIAKIKDASDPALNHRVRVLFSWQSDADVKEATPWLPFAAKGEGKITTGKHNKGDEVIVGFIDGNVERPYVLGATQTRAPHDKTINVDIDTPGGHHMRLSDGSGAGLLKFISSAFSPALNTFCNFFPVSQIPFLGELLKEDKVWSKNKYFEGSATLSDFYGIYKITGSTDKRNVTISSPWGDVKMDAFTGITISAPNGDVKIKGKNVSIEAGNNLTLESGTNIGWKLRNDKKFGDFSADALGLTVSSAVASKVAEKTKLLDLSLVRSVVEVVMRPVEGALTVKSNRFLKLESGKNECEYPKLAFNQDEKKRLLDAAAKKKIATGAADLSDGVTLMFEMTLPIVMHIFDKFVNLFNDCYVKKVAFEESISDLKTVANNDNPVCNTYEELKAVFWDSDKNKNIEANDIGFKDNVKIEGDANEIVSAECYQRILFLAEPDSVYVIDARTRFRAKIVETAKALREATVKVLDFKMTQSEIDKEFGFFRWTSLPKDAKKMMFNAVSREKCSTLPFYKISSDVKKLESVMKRMNKNVVITARRTICLNLLKELGLDKNRAPLAQDQAVPPEPKVSGNSNKSEGDILHDSTWRNYVDSLRAMPELKKESHVGQTVKDAFYKQFTDMDTAANFKKSYDEMYAWAEGNPGGILFGAKKNTYMVDPNDEGGFDITKVESLKPLERLTALEGGDEAGTAIINFMSQIKHVLRRI